MKPRSQTNVTQIRALKVRQWLSEWDRVHFDSQKYRAKPNPHFYLFSLDAHKLKALSGIERRVTSGRLANKEDLGIQRRHERERSDEIRRFVEFGYPWSELSEAKRKTGEFEDLRKPGWLPTAVVVNILGIHDRRRGRGVHRDDLITVYDDGDSALIALPPGFSGPGWRPKELSPIEVIDGQHRLWAFDTGSLDGAFEIPVVAFSGLGLSWQAYQFWTINIKPKRINPSLAFDLYPLLRTEDWLDRFDGHPIYRETRAQELVQSIWSHPESPWYQRINMLGESKLGRGMASQASWIRSLLATFVRPRQKGNLGGLFASPINSHEEVFPWSRTQQAAFLIFAGSQMRQAVKDSQADWVKELRKGAPAGKGNKDEDPAFSSPVSLLTADVGIRGFLYVTNDLCCVRSQELSLGAWASDESSDPDVGGISSALKSLSKQKVGHFIKRIANHLAKFDWRSSAAPGLTPEETTVKKTLRGNGGYREIRRLLISELAEAKDDVGSAAKIVLKKANLS